MRRGQRRIIKENFKCKVEIKALTTNEAGHFNLVKIIWLDQNCNHSHSVIQKKNWKPFDSPFIIFITSMYSVPEGWNEVSS